MPIFEPVTVSWEGVDYVLPGGEILRTIARVEDVITMVQITRSIENRDLPLAKISQAYGILLRACGARVSDEDVYERMFKGDDLQAVALRAVVTLQSLMIPPQKLREKMAAAAGGKPEGATSTSPSSPSGSKLP